MSDKTLRSDYWLPTTKKEVIRRGWSTIDVVLFSGDAYVDHPSFGTAVISRLLESYGLNVVVISQPNWQDDLRDFKKMGRPNLFFAVTAGCMDSMVNHYTANKRRRSNDAYTAGGLAGFRPDYTTIVYSTILKDLYPDVPIIIGGIEASLRRVTHYDYWSDQLMPSILIDSKADLLVYGMGELPLKEIVRIFKSGGKISDCYDIPQLAYLDDQPTIYRDDIKLYSHEVCKRDKKKFAANFKHIEQQSNSVQAKRIIQPVKKQFVVINPPYPPMRTVQMDEAFALPFTRLPHPKYNKRGPIPAYEMIKFSINMHRGCFGGCSFCTISAHQGKFIASRSEASVLNEVEQVVAMPGFKGYITDLGGPSANMYQMKGKVQSICDRCVSPSCIHPVVCSNLDTSHAAMTALYKKVDAHPKIKKAFVSSGIRYDLLVDSYNKQNDDSLKPYMDQLVRRHISGRLKVAPEHSSPDTLKIMRKPSFEYFKQFKQHYDQCNKKHGLNQPLIPYFISSHPGCKEEDMANLAADTKDLGFRLEQVQGFTPTPMTVATVIYYTGVHPYTLRPIYTAKSKQEKKNQHIFFFWYKKENRALIKNKLLKMNRTDLITRLLKTQKRKRYTPTAIQQKDQIVGKTRRRQSHRRIND